MKVWAVAAVLALVAAWPVAGHAGECRPPEPELAEFRRAEAGRISADRLRVEQLVRRTLGTGVSLSFGEVRQRVPAYGDWAYGWVESYVTSYELVIRGLLAGVQAGAAPWDPEVRAAIAGAARRFVFNRFDQLVVRPARLPERLHEEWAAATSLAESEWGVARARSRAAVARFLGEHCPEVPGPATADGDGGPSLRTASGRPLASAGTIEGIYRLDGAGDAETIFLRSTRPFGARLAIMLARLTEAGSAIAVGGIFGIGGLTGPISGFVGVLATVWTLDWAINRGDELIHRASMEQELQGLVGDIEQEMLRGMETLFAESLGAAAEEEIARLSAIGR